MKDRDAFQRALEARGLAVETRALSVGDIVWMVEREEGSGTVEYMTDVIIERKAMDDFVSSIVDGRYKEQKFRLTKAGLRRPCYLVEVRSGSPQGKLRRVSSIGMDTVETALCSIQVQHGISVLQSDSFDDTVMLLYSIHQELLHSLAARPLVTAPTFAQFMSRTSKSGNLQAGDIFAKMLLQINGLSPARAKVVLAVYPTIGQLSQVLLRNQKALHCAVREGRRPETLFSELVVDGKRLGKAMGMKIAEAFL
jgi:crossover junction endonuclease MUS81